MTAHQFPVWKELSYGGMTRNQLLKAFDTAGVFVGIWARDIMGQKGFVTPKKPQVIRLAKAPLRDLGFTEPVGWSGILARVAELGHDKCPPAVGPHTRLEDKGQARGDIYWFAMDPITGSRGGPGVFGAGRRDDGGRWLRGCHARPGHRWNPDNSVVFALRE
jgi:hypothetical protein